MNHPRLSVIIPCLNEADYIGELLKDLANQDIDEPFEVVVADSSSDDGTLEVARQFSDKLNLKLTNTDHMSAGHTRNAGAEVASGEFFLFLDADGGISPDFLRVLMNERDKHDADMMTTHFRATGWHPYDNFHYLAISRYYFKQSFEINDPHMSGCVQFVASELHQKINGYKDELTVGEDMDYSARIAEVARTPLFVESLTYYASNRRFKTDGRITMFLRSAKWLGGTQFDIAQADEFDFGHYGLNSKKITIKDLLLKPKLCSAFVAAIWIHIKVGIKTI